MGRESQVRLSCDAGVGAHPGLKLSIEDQARRFAFVTFDLSRCVNSFSLRKEGGDAMGISRLSMEFLFFRQDQPPLHLLRVSAGIEDFFLRQACPE